MARMKQFIHRRFVLHYFALTVLFLLLFHFLKSYYLRDIHQTPYSIDEYVLLTGNFFDPSYLIIAKYSGYDYARYYLSFFVADMIFPLIYTFLFLSIISGMKKDSWKLLFWISIIGCCISDYLEDFSFVAFLSMRGDELAQSVAVLTAIKSLLFLVNVATGVGCLLYYWKTDKSINRIG
ncbi:MAG: hypothetical protein ABIN36_16675 [Ferruginibacter sp.]